MCAGQWISLSALVRNPHKGPNGETSHETGSGGEKKVPEKREGQLTKEDGEKQSTTESRRDVDNGEQKRPVGVRYGRDGQHKKAVREDNQRWVGIPSGFCRSFAQTSAIVYRCTEKAKCHIEFPLLAFGADPSQRLFVYLFSSTLSVLFYVAVKKCVISIAGNEEQKH